MIIAQNSDKYCVRWDESRGSVEIDLGGIWSPDDLREFYPIMEKATAKSRMRHGRALMLVDISAGQVMQSSLVEQIQSDNPSYIRPDDRVATVIQSTLLKMQLKRGSGNTATEHQYFASREEAHRWLHDLA